jgi:hypothetical protein
MTENTDIDFFEFVDSGYMGDAKIEKSLGSNELKDGMVVLIAGANRRVNLPHLMQNRHNDWLMEKALRYNRWYTISNVRFFGDQVAFLAEYKDGSKDERVEPIYTNWIVKKDSLDIEAKKRKAVERLVKDMLLQQDSATYHGKSVDAPKVSDVVDAIYKILGL